MAYEIPGYKLTRLANSAISQYRFVEMDADGEVDEANADTDIAIGVAQGAVDAAGKAVEIMVTGISKVVAGGVVAVNDLVNSDGTGRAITNAAGDRPLGRALTAAAAAGEIVSVLLLTPSANAIT